MKQIINKLLTLLVYLVIILIALYILREMFTGQRSPDPTNGYNYGQIVTTTATSYS